MIMSGAMYGTIKKIIYKNALFVVKDGYYGQCVC